MADNVAITAGTGTSIATDDVSSVHFQKVKLDGGGDGSSTPILAGNGVAADSVRVTVASDSTGQVAAVGKAAHDAAVSGAPVYLGAKALAIGQATSDVSADGDAVGLLATRGGRLYVATEHPNRWQAQGSYTSAQTNTSLKTAPGSGLSLYITDVIVSNGATAGEVKLLDGSGGTVLVHLYHAANGGAVMNLHTPIKLTANTALCLTSATVTTHTITIVGFTGA